MSGSPLVILATGGTGGHVYPALALAAELQRHGVRTLLVGARGGIEERLSEEAGVRFEGVPAGKLDRSRPDPRELYRALKGLTRARGIVRREKPKLVIGFGGFASLPAAAAAAWSGVPLWLNEQNAYPGLVTRLLARRAELVVASVSAALTRLRARNTLVLPYPVDETPFTRQEARKLLGLPEEGLLTLVMGGSQGAVALNVAVVRAAQSLGERFPLTLHVTGPNNHADVLGAAPELPQYRIEGYVDGRAAFAAADLAITRAGIGTLSMAALNGVPLIMVPLPSASENHQHHNASAFAEAGAGVLLEQAELHGLEEAWLRALAPESLQEAASAISAFSPAGAATAFGRAVLERLGKEPGS